MPGIRYVVDPGTARISRYSRRTKVQRLPIEPISQASAAQRAGRSGRVAPGVCIRLYSEDDFASRPRYTDPEILRTNLAAVILQMAALQLGDMESFPFLDPPDQRSIRDGVQLLQELGAFDNDGAITAVGRRLAQLPVDPRLAPDDPAGRGRRMRARSARARGGAGDPGSARTARRPRGGRSAEARPVRRRALRLPVLPEPVALSAGAAKGAVRQLISADVPRGVPALSAHPRMAGPGRAAAQHRPRHGHPRAGRAGGRRACACGGDRRAVVAYRSARR